MSDIVPGHVAALDARVTRVVAPNPGPFTFHGTNSYIIGTDRLAVIDPGPDLPGHIDALLAAIGGRPVDAILCTHTHRDHSPAAAPLRAATGAPVIGCAALLPAEEGGGFDAAFDRDYRPDRTLADGETLGGDGWTLTALATPGHTSNHLCFALDDMLFSGDHVMGWSTSVVIPPDGDMGAYLASLDTLLRRDDRVYYPGHGDPVAHPRRLVRGMIGHRKQREGQILRLLRRDERPVPALVADMYAGLDPRLVGAAGASVLAHLLDLQGRGLVAQEGEAWRIAA